MNENKYQLRNLITKILILVFALLLAGCAGKSDFGLVQKEQELIYVAHPVAIQLPDELTQVSCFFSNDDFIFWGNSGSTIQTSVYQVSLKDMKQAAILGKEILNSFKEPVLALDGRELAFCMGQNGLIYFLEYVPDVETGEARYMLNIYDNEKLWMCTKSLDITETLLMSQITGQDDIRLSISLMAVDSQGMIYFCSQLTNSTVWVLDNSGRKIAALEMENTYIEDMALGSDGQIYATAGKNNKNEIFIISSDGNRVDAEVPLVELPYGGGAGKFITEVTDSFLFSTSTDLYQCGLNDGQGKSLFEWSNAGLSGSNIKTTRLLSEDELWVASLKLGGRDLRVTLLTSGKSEDAVEEETTVTDGIQGIAESGQESTIQTQSIEGDNSTVVKEKQTILLMGANKSIELEELIGLFNVSQSDYEVIVQEYESTERLYMEIASGKGPDLIRLDFIDVEQFVEKGLLLDLQPYLESSAVLDREKLVDSVCRLNTVQGVLTCIPPAFTLDIITGRATDLGTETGWTFEEFFKYIEANEGAAIVEGASFGDSRYACFSLATHTKLSKYVDWETGDVSFDHGEFEKLLRFAGEYQSLYDEDNSYDTVGRIRDKKVLLYNAGIRNAENYLFQREVFQEEVAFIGYPTDDGSPCYGLRNIYGFGVRSASNVKEGAWAFIEFLISNQKADDVIQKTFPTMKSEFNKLLEKSQVEKIGMDKYGNYVEQPKYRMQFPSGIWLEAYAASQKDVDRMRKLVEGATYLSREGGTVDKIVEEEILNFFNGDKTAEETVSVIQNRVELYVGEQAE